MNIGRAMKPTLKSVVVLPIGIIVIQVGTVFLLPYSNIFTRQYEIENEMFRKLRSFRINEATV